MKKSSSNIRISEIIYRHLSGNISGDEQEMMECWLKNEKNATFFMELKNSNRIFDGLSGMLGVDTDKHFSQLQRKMKRAKRLKFLKILGSVAAVLVITVGVVWFVDNHKPAPALYSSMYLPQEDQVILHTVEGRTVVLPDTIKVVRGTLKKLKQNLPVQHEKNNLSCLNVLNSSSRGNIEVALCDGSRVWLNANSILRYPNEFVGKQRKVYLEGEAYFEVAKNIIQPFVVHTGKAEIEVLGTRFNVNIREEKPCVTTLIEGCVKVKNTKEDSVIIYPGQQVLAYSMGDMEVKTVNTRYFTAWQKNYFAFYDETFYHIMTVLSDWYDFTFEFETGDLTDLKFTTTIQRYEKIEDVLKILQCTGSFVFSRDSNGNIKIKKD